MILQNVNNRDLKERRLCLKEEKLQLEKERHAVRASGRKLDHQFKIPFKDSGNRDGIAFEAHIRSQRSGDCRT